MRQEAGVDTMALASQRLHVNSNGIVENVLYSLADHNPRQYADSFHKVAAWVDNSLDLYRVRKTRLHSACSKPALLQIVNPFELYSMPLSANNMSMLFFPLNSCIHPAG